MKKKLLSVMLASAMLTGTLAGCGAGGSDASQTPAQTGDVESANADADAGTEAEAPAAGGDEGTVLNIWCWNDEFQSRFNDYYPDVESVSDDKSTTTLKDGITVKWTINPTTDNNYQNK